MLHLLQHNIEQNPSTRGQKALGGASAVPILLLVDEVRGGVLTNAPLSTLRLISLRLLDLISHHHVTRAEKAC